MLTVIICIVVVLLLLLFLISRYTKTKGGYYFPEDFLIVGENKIHDKASAVTEFDKAENEQFDLYFLDIN